MTSAPLHSRIAAAPVVHDRERAERVLGDLDLRCGQEPELGALGPLIALPPVRDLLAGTLGASPYLAMLIERHPARLLAMLSAAPEERFDELCRKVADALATAETTADAMRALRVCSRPMSRC